MRIFNFETGAVSEINEAELMRFASVYIKWDDDRGRSFDNVCYFDVNDGWVELIYMHPEAGKTKIKINESGIRWIELFEKKPEYNE